MDTSLGESVLAELRDKSEVTSDMILAKYPGYTLEQLHGTLLSLASKERLTFSISDATERCLTEEGKETITTGSHEYKLFEAVGADGAGAELISQNPLGAKHAFKKRWIKLEGNRLYRVKDQVIDSVTEALKNLSLIDEKEFNELKRRNLVSVRKRKIYTIRRGPLFEEDRKDLLPGLTSAIVVDYKGERFKRYNFNSTGNFPVCGALHPLLKMRTEVRQIFLEMGFSEMNTSKYVESSFWNFDSLFQPQNHPARDSHDTFFLRRPYMTKRFDEQYLEKVWKVHTRGGYGSTGHGGVWAKEEAARNILRTHTTAVSSRNLKELAKNFSPVKLFSIDKVFRNESIDATHLAEFHQVEGLIAGYSLGIGDLMGVLEAFFKKLGIPKVRFKPAFNPYTEPSMEVFGFHSGLGRWIEIGNSGIFRPEMLGPMGYPPEVSVIAWGLSLERPAMIKFGVKNIRDLVGHRVDVDFIRNSGFVCFN